MELKESLLARGICFKSDTRLPVGEQFEPPIDDLERILTGCLHHNF
jgi:hypothetical protein